MQPQCLVDMRRDQRSEQAAQDGFRGRGRSFPLGAGGHLGGVGGGPHPHPPQQHKATAEMRRAMQPPMAPHQLSPGAYHEQQMYEMQHHQRELNHQREVLHQREMRQRELLAQQQRMLRQRRAAAVAQAAEMHEDVSPSQGRGVGGIGGGAPYFPLGQDRHHRGKMALNEEQMRYQYEQQQQQQQRHRQGRPPNVLMPPPDGPRPGDGPNGRMGMMGPPRIKFRPSRSPTEEMMRGNGPRQQQPSLRQGGGGGEQEGIPDMERSYSQEEKVGPRAVVKNARSQEQTSQGQEQEARSEPQPKPARMKTESRPDESPSAEKGSAPVKKKSSGSGNNNDGGPPPKKKKTGAGYDDALLLAQVSAIAHGECTEEQGEDEQEQQQKKQQHPSSPSKGVASRGNSHENDSPPRQRGRGPYQEQRMIQSQRSSSPDTPGTVDSGGGAPLSSGGGGGHHPPHVTPVLGSRAGPQAEARQQQQMRAGGGGPNGAGSYSTREISPMTPPEYYRRGGGQHGPHHPGTPGGILRQGQGQGQKNYPRSLQIPAAPREGGPYHLQQQRLKQQQQQPMEDVEYYYEQGKGQDGNTPPRQRSPGRQLPHGGNRYHPYQQPQGRGVSPERYRQDDLRARYDGLDRRGVGGSGIQDQGQQGGYYPPRYRGEQQQQAGPFFGGRGGGGPGGGGPGGGHRRTQSYPEATPPTPSYQDEYYYSDQQGGYEHDTPSRPTSSGPSPPRRQVPHPVAVNPSPAPQFTHHYDSPTRRRMAEREARRVTTGRISPPSSPLQGEQQGGEYGDYYPGDRDRNWRDDEADGGGGRRTASAEVQFLDKRPRGRDRTGNAAAEQAGQQQQQSYPLTPRGDDPASLPRYPEDRARFSDPGTPGVGYGGPPSSSRPAEGMPVVPLPPGEQQQVRPAYINDNPAAYQSPGGYYDEPPPPHHQQRGGGGGHYGGGPRPMHHRPQSHPGNPQFSPTPPSSAGSHAYGGGGGGGGGGYHDDDAPRHLQQPRLGAGGGGMGGPPHQYPHPMAEAQRTILRRKFSWKHYPELEAFLIANREEYLRHSALNYTIQQKQYNNRLTERLLELAARHNYVFDEDVFSFVAVRDRIRCYYKSYVQSSKKRGVLIGYGSKKKMGLLPPRAGGDPKQQDESGETGGTGGDPDVTDSGGGGGSSSSPVVKEDDDGAGEEERAVDHERERGNGGDGASAEDTHNEKE